MYPNRVWTINRYIDNKGNPCDYDDLDAIPMWSSHEPTAEDRLRRRRATLEATERREQAKAMQRAGVELLEPLRRPG